MEQAPLVKPSTERNAAGQFVLGNPGGQGRGTTARRTKGRAVNRSWVAKNRILRAAMGLDGAESFESLLRTFAQTDPIDYVKWVVAELTPNYPSEVAKPEIDLIAQAGFSPQDLIEQIETARRQASAIEQPTIVKPTPGSGEPTAPDPTPDPTPETLPVDNE